MRTGTATLPLHGGQAPAWLFVRMVELSREITRYIVCEFGVGEMLTRLADPIWFQSLGCVLGFDWHSSGLTTTTTGALKEGLKNIGPEMGLFIAGGKGKASRKTPDEILEAGEKHAIARPADTLVYASRMSAKVDNTAVDDGYQLYHHCFVFTNTGDWAVIQQGMNDANGMARRYHWHWTPQSNLDFVNEPHTGVISAAQAQDVLNMVAKESENCRKVCTGVASDSPDKIEKELTRLQELEMPRAHGIAMSDLLPSSVARVLLTTYENPPADFEALLGTRGLGPKCMRSLALISEVLYGAPASRRDPARYSFAHGGKDGIPYPVDRENYDRSIAILREAVAKAKVGDTERTKALSRLASWEGAKRYIRKSR
jgi:uncharacterized protein